MPNPSAAHVTRTVISHDPSLSDEANRLLTDELRLVIGGDSVELDEGSPDHSGDRHGHHNAAVVGAVEMRLMLSIVGLMFVMIGTIVLVGLDGYWWLLLALGALGPTTVIVATVITRMTDEFEHLSPETAAVLSHEGVPDPDGFFTQLVGDFGGRDHGLALPGR
jgi:hypothetical protein